MESIRNLATRLGVGQQIAAMPEAPTELSMPDRQMMAKAWRLAVEVHGLQTDRGGEPYLFHIARVAMALRTPMERACGLLHDVLEDAENAGGYHDIIRTEFPVGVVEACEALCRAEGEDYMRYVTQLAEDPLAAVVKVSDLRDNLRPDRLRLIPPPKRWDLKTRYEAALKYLVQRYPG